MMNNERLRILELIESGHISVEEGVRQLEGLVAAETSDGAQSAEASVLPGEQLQSPAEFPLPAIARIAWRIVFGVGVSVVGAGGYLLARAYGRAGMPGLTWGWVLFALGLLVLLLGWWLQRARWFYLRVREHDGRAFTIALPLPLGLVLALLRIASPFVPQLQEMEVDQVLLAMRDELEQGRSFAVNVDEGEDGDQVELYFC
ncbi:MAG: hypothetical protein U9R72_16850 [Chloroflexota bacterium]|nr:hypothetical protein [Chloroflexota bacterium]